MRKSVIATAEPSGQFGTWLDLDQIASVEVSSEHPEYPVESVFTTSAGRPWRAATPGLQTIRIIFDQPKVVSRIRLEFSETEVERTQEFVLLWGADGPAATNQIVRQQWNFSPTGSQLEMEEYEITLNDVTSLELTIVPNIGGGASIATLRRWLVA